MGFHTCCAIPKIKHLSPELALLPVWSCDFPVLSSLGAEMALELLARLGAQKQRLREEMKAQNGEENETSCLENDSLALLMNVPCSLQVLSLPRFPSPSSQTADFCSVSLS